MSAIFKRIFLQSSNATAVRFSNNIRLFSSKDLSDATGSKEHKTTAPDSAKLRLNKNILKQLVNTNKVVIFMKGNPEAPRCGFSNAVVQILRMHGVKYDAHDVLQDDELRQSIKEFSDWPTIPQVFINGEFVGGCDILLQMHQSGDLITELRKVGIESQLLKIEKTDANDTKEKPK